MSRHQSHLALTVWPITALLFFAFAHFWPALSGASAYAAASPVSWLSQAASTAVVVAFALAYVLGWAVLRREAPESPGPYRTKGGRRLQAWAGGLAWTLVLGHFGLEWAMLFESGPVSLSHYEILRAVLSRPVALAAYVAGLAALGLFLSQGWAASVRALQDSDKLESSRWVDVGCTLLAASMFLLAINVLSHFATGRAYWSSPAPTPVRAKSSEALPSK